MKKRNIWSALVLCVAGTLSAYGGVSSTNCTVTFSTDNISSCTAYTWTNGVTYTADNNTAKDTFVNAAGCDSIVSLDLKIEDKINPIVITKNITVSLNAAGTASIIASQINNGSSDNCNIASLSLSKSTFDCSNLGANTIYLLAIDGYGNVGSASAVVTVRDLIKPTVMAKNLLVSLNSTGQASITPTQIDSGSTDNCSVASFSLSKSSFNCSNVGPNNVYLIVTDVDGNKDSAISIVTIQDVIKPSVSTQNLTLNLNSSGVASVSASQVDNGSTDNCTIASITLSKTTFDCSNLGTNTVYLIVEDGFGNVDSASAIITVQDTTKTVLITQNITVNLGSTGTATINASQINNGSSGNCTVNYQLTKTNFTCADIGSNTIWLIATDAAGNVNAASATVTILDVIKPTLITHNVTISLDATGNGSITIAQVDNGSSDNCGIATLTLSKSSFDCSNIGNNTVYLIATDANGNVDSASAIITVQDLIKPTVIAQNLTLSLDATGNGSVSTAQVNNGSSDNCGIANFTLSKSSFDCSNIGDNTVYLIATDANGNVDTASAVITVEDVFLPTAIAQNLTVSLGALGQASITANQIDGGSSDNCSYTLTVNKSSWDCSEIGIDTVWLKITDASGNVDSASAIITVQDVNKPVVVTQNIVASLDASGQATVTVAQIDNGSSDNCSIATLALSKSTFDCANVGVNTIYLIATDINGNIDSASAIVTVQDTSLIVLTQNITVSLDSFGQSSITASDIDNGSNNTCGISTFALSKSSFDCSNIGANTIYLIATDVSGNVDSTMAIVTVQDTIQSNLLTQDIVVTLDSFGQASITTSQIDNGSSDNCSLTLTLSKYAFDCSNIGSNTIYLYATDASGSIDSASALVTVQDTIKTYISAQNITVSLDSNGQASITPSQIDNGSSDNCNLYLSLSNSNFDCSNVGTNMIYLIATDVSGNIDSASAIVTIQDTLKPIVRTKNISVILDASGNAFIQPFQVNMGSSDNCKIASFDLSKRDFDCTEIGDHVIYLFAEDFNGNRDSASTIVTVLDTKPNVITQNVTVYLDDLGTASVSLSQIDNGSSDNCGIASLAISKSTFDCSNLGINTINLTAVDVNGNIGTATAEVNVQDSIKPVSKAQDLSLNLDENGLVTITPGQIDNGSSDNCGIASIALSKSNFDCSDIGTNTIYLVVTDANGNQDSAMAVVTIQDNIKPTVLTKSIVTVLDATGQVVVAVAEIDKGSSDNCGIASMVLSKSDFDCSNLGTNPVYLIVTDVNGNIDSASALITIKDTISPVIVTTPSDIAFGYCDAKYTYALPVATDNCTFSITQTEGLPPGSIFPLGFTRNTFEIKDLSDNAVTTSFTVEIRSGYLPFIFRDTTLCSNEAKIDLADGTGSLTFLGAGIQSDGIIFNPVLSGPGDFLITAVFTDTMGCTSLDSLNIMVREAPQTPKIVREASDQIATELTYDSYQWYRNGTLLQGENAQLYMAQELGIYSVVVSTADYCFATSEGYDFGMPVNDEQVTNQGNVRVYPNPTDGIVFAEINDNDATHTLTITDGLGTELMVMESTSGIVRIDLTDFASGAYFLNVTSVTTNTNIKIIKN
jgi:hypothetical protein